MKTGSKADPKKALAVLRRLKAIGLTDRFRGMTEEETLRQLKQTREELWREKLATRS